MSDNIILVSRKIIADDIVERIYEVEGYGYIRFELTPAALLVHPVPNEWKPSHIRPVRRALYSKGLEIMNELEYDTWVVYTSKPKLARLFIDTNRLAHVYLGEFDYHVYIGTKEIAECQQ